MAIAGFCFFCAGERIPARPFRVRVNGRARGGRGEEEEESWKPRPAGRANRVLAPVWGEEQLIISPFRGGTRRVAPPGPAHSAPV